jgi:hypothetical protein
VAYGIAGVGKPHRPRDPNQLGKAIIDLATGQTNELPGKHRPPPPKLPEQIYRRNKGLK